MRLIVQITALLISGGFAYIAYSEPALGIVPLCASAFFALMACLSIKNKGNIDGPFIYFACSAVGAFYTSIGLLTGKYPWKSSFVSIEKNPQDFWLTFLFFLTVSIGALVVGISKYRSRKMVGIDSAIAQELQVDMKKVLDRVSEEQRLSVSEKQELEASLKSTMEKILTGENQTRGKPH